MSIDMIAIELNRQTIDRIMAVAAFVWPTLTTEALTKTYEDALVERVTYYFVPQFIFIWKFASPHECVQAVLISDGWLKEDFDYEITDRTQPFTITRKS